MTAQVTNRDVATWLDGGSPAANPEARKLVSYPLLDWLRYVLASTVLLAHSSVHFPGPINGGLAVSVFLALSGWLIGGILLKTEAADLPRFFYNRSTRIWAPYFFCMVLLYGCAAVARGIDGNWFKYLFYDATFTHYTFTTFPRALSEMPLAGTGNHFWSISVEEQFYLAAPLLMVFTRWGRSLGTWLAITAVLTIAQSTFTPIAAGVTAAVLNRDHAIVATAARRWIAAAVAAAMLALCWHWNMQPFLALFSIALVLALTMGGPRTRLGVFLGGISYPLYLNQWIGGFAVAAIAKHVIPIPDLLHLILTYGASVAAAIGTWWFVDRTVMLRRDDWYTPARGRACAVIAYALLAIGLVGGTILYLNGY